MAGAATASAFMLPQVAANQSQRSKNYVLASGSWHGGWCWRRVAAALRSAGHQVYTPSFTGLGDRAHLLSKQIQLDTFVDDLINVIVSEELDQVVLVGHSFGGTALAGVADRIPDRLGHLVYLDGVILENGQSAFDAYRPEDREARMRSAEQANGGIAVPVPATLPPLWGLAPGAADYDWVKRRLTPHPLNSYTTALELRGPIGNGLPRTYIECVMPSHPGLVASKALARSLGGWSWKTLAAPHDAMVTHPREVSALLLAINS